MMHHTRGDRWTTLVWLLLLFLAVVLGLTCNYTGGWL